MHTAGGSLRLRSRGAHCDPELARQDRRSRLAKQIGDEDWRGRKQGGRRKEGGGGGGGGRTTVIKSNKPHLAGGELLLAGSGFFHPGFDEHTFT